MENLNANQTLRTTLNLMKLTFGIVPIVAGLDKFTNLLTNWVAYVSPWVADLLPFSADSFMMLVGIIEMVAGIIVLWKPKIGGLIVAGWLGLIALSLLVSGEYLDVAVRDLVLAICAFSLAKISGELG